MSCTGAEACRVGCTTTLACACWPGALGPLSLLLGLLLIPKPAKAEAENAGPLLPSLSILRAGTGALMIDGRIPQDCYAVVEQSSPPGSAFRPLTVLIPPNPGVIHSAIPLPRTSGAAVFRLRSIALATPEDQDGDGIDDVYEVRRNQMLNPLDPSDALRDSDGDGVNNLTEYIDRTEAAPARSDAPVQYESLDALRASARIPLPPMVHLGGYTSDGDGWGGWFAWREGDTRPDDGGLVVEVMPGQRGRLERIVEAGEAVQTAWWRPPTNGVTDAGPRLQRAFDYVSTRVVKRLVINPGRYHITSRIAYLEPDQCPLRLVGVDDFTVDGAGATIVTDTDGEMLMLMNCHRGTVQNLAFRGAGSDRSLKDGNYTAVALGGRQSDLIFSRCTITGFMHGISHLHGEKTSVRVTVRECRFEDGSDMGHGTLGSDGAGVSGVGDDWLIENNYFYECGRSIEIENTAQDLPISRVQVRANRIVNVRNLGIVAFLGSTTLGSSQQSDVVLRDNVIIGKSPRHIDPRGNVVPIIHLSVNGGSRWIIQGNICRDGDYAGISLYSNQAPIEDCLVTGNVISDIGGRGIQIYSTTTMMTRGIVISNNRITTCYEPAIVLTGEHLIAQGNLIENSAIGISLGDVNAPFLPTTDVVVRANTLSGFPSGFPAIVIAPAANRCTIADNDISQADIGIRDLSGRTTVAGNRFSNVGLEIDTPAE